MQIGTGNNRLPGSAPAANDAAPADVSAPAPVSQPAAPVEEAPSPGRKWVYLVVLLLLAGTAGVYFLLGSGAKLKIPVPDVKQVWAQLVAALPGMGAAPATNGVVLTAAQRQAVAEYSPSVPIKEARRVKDLVRSHVAGADDTVTNAAVVAVPANNSSVEAKPPVEVKTAAPAPATPTPSKPVPAATTSRAGTGGAKDQTDTWPELQVSATIGGANAKWFARINGQLVRTGDKVDRVTVVMIASDRVTLELNGEQRDFHVGSRR